MNLAIFANFKKWCYVFNYFESNLYICSYSFWKCIIIKIYDKEMEHLRLKLIIQLCMMCVELRLR